MCGIAGFVSAVGGVTPFQTRAVQEMSNHMRRRGPDAHGIWQRDGAILAHRRLAILDLDHRSDQPMTSSDGRYVIVFNGEIYNFRELRNGLEADGIKFRTSSDTEVLLALFAREGERMLPRLRGMFAFAVWDSQLSELFMARDAYGIKPLYYAYTHEGLAFASQVKAILASGLISCVIEPAGLAGFYLWGSVQEPWTLYSGILALPCGNFLRLRSGSRPEPKLWFDIRQNWRIASADKPDDEVQDAVRHCVRDSVRAHLVADVPVSVFLSAGIDSTVIAGMAHELGAAVTGITVVFEEFAGRHEDEGPLAGEVARYYGLKHHVRRVPRPEFEQDLPLILESMDQPSIDGVNSWFASKAAAELGFKVALSGVGGDELFFGYSNFRSLPKAVRIGRLLSAIPGARVLLNLPLNHLAKSRSNPKLAAVSQYMNSLAGSYFLKRALFLPAELLAIMGDDLAREGLRRLGGAPPGISFAPDAFSDEAAIGLLESTFYMRNQLLRDSDWASMAHSVELRTPLVDGALLAGLSPILSYFTGGCGKQMLASSPTKPLPESISRRVKTGFCIPMASWLSNPERSTGPTAAIGGESWARLWAKAVIKSILQTAPDTACAAKG